MPPGYHFHPPSPLLAPFVDHFWLLEEMPTATRQMILPDGGLELILNLGIHQRLHDRFALDRFVLHKDAWISGLRHDPIIIGTPGPMSIIGVRFKTFGAHRFLRVPLHEVANQVLDATLVLGSAVRALRDHIACSPTPAAKFALFEAYLLRRMDEPPLAEALLGKALQELAHAEAEGRVADVAADLGTSPKHLRRLFRDHVGISPKSVFRVNRFQRVVQHLEGMATVDWAQVAVRFGFFDQPHLIKEFKAFTDGTPSDYLARRGPYLNYLAVP